MTWSKVASFTWPGTYVQDATSEYTADPVGIAWVTFDSSSGTKGSATPRIFVGKFACFTGDVTYIAYTSRCC